MSDLLESYKMMTRGFPYIQSMVPFLGGAPLEVVNPCACVVDCQLTHFYGGLLTTDLKSLDLIKVWGLATFGKSTYLPSPKEGSPAELSAEVREGDLRSPRL